MPKKTKMSLEEKRKVNNAREKQRIALINENYEILKGHLPPEYREHVRQHKDILQAATAYIQHLKDTVEKSSGDPSTADVLNAAENRRKGATGEEEEEEKKNGEKNVPSMTPKDKRSASV